MISVSPVTAVIFGIKGDFSKDFPNISFADAAKFLSINTISSCRLKWLHEMKIEGAQLNLLMAWLWILLGFVSGMVLGMFFHREGWLGGYASLKRRMYRLAHISFFGLGSVNLFFWLTVKNLSASSMTLSCASWAFVLGAVTMPICCVVMAHFPKLHMIFTLPVLSLITGGVLTLLGVAKP